MTLDRPDEDTRLDCGMFSAIRLGFAFIFLQNQSSERKMAGIAQIF